ncbi:hypothetical protein J1N35_003825 [Gossypium stocksii]|uniref:Wall-associated receptor kinase galacturonan-binding domain-containing protein n=1 Tax=Gossypium stocksii TaxID=47602 RepID=A0A9D4AHN8_9ROSI|nr:hypothetical protein J1N35_003825 [Gossypium stocksii]
MATLALFLLVYPGACLGRHRYQDCGSVFCGNLSISYPLRLKNQPLHFGYHNLELECEKNNRTTLVLGKGKFFVQQIFYKNDSMRAVDASLDMDDCNSLPLNQDTPPSDFNQFCTVEAEVPIMVDNIIGMSTLDIYNKLSEGIVVSWSTYNRCGYKRSFQDLLNGVKIGLRRYRKSFEHFIFHWPYRPPANEIAGGV